MLNHLDALLFHVELLTKSHQNVLAVKKEEIDPGI